MHTNHPGLRPTTVRLAATAAIVALIGAVLPTALPATAMSVRPSAPTTAAAQPTLSEFSFREQKLNWKRCSPDSTAQCASFKVPLDYDDPSGPRLRIAVSRQKATGPTRLGSVVFNPGGPGGSGAEFVEQGISSFPRGIRASYDLIGIDPRGVGGSTQINCQTQAEYDNRPQSMPTDLESRRIFVGDLQDFARGCDRLSPDMMAHVGTRNAARDMDILRSILGEQKLNYLGISYGTYLGAVYSSLFGDRVGRFVLDANMDPGLRMRGLGKGQAKGFQNSLNRWAEACAASAQCQFRGDAEAVVETFTRKFLKVNTTPLPVAGGSGVTFEETIRVLMTGLSGGRSAWQWVSLVASALQQNDGTLIRSYSPLMQMSINMISANTAINCFDRSSPGSQRIARDLIRTWRAAAPTFAMYMGWGAIGCSSWPVTDAQGPGDIPYSGAPPILLVGGTNDPATPLGWTFDMQRKLPGSRVLVWDGDGHGASTKGDSCVNATLTRFFVHGRLPANGKRCTAAY